MSDLIDTTEMFLRTIYELVEEGIVPMRARISERLGQSGPTVSQTVARMQRDGLVELDQDDRHLEFTPLGRDLAVRVMRKHRLAECLLVDVIGLPWEQVHVEACRWEHVMSEAVERRIVDILGHPSVSPFGNPIPGLEELSGAAPAAGMQVPVPDGRPVLDGLGVDPQVVAVVRIAESLQSDEALMAALRAASARPGETIAAAVVDGGIRVVGVGATDEAHGVGGAAAVELQPGQAAQVIVRDVGAA